MTATPVRYTTTTETRLIDTMTAAREQSIQDLQKLADSYLRSIDSPQTDAHDKAVLKGMRQSFLDEIEDLRRGQE